MQGNEEAKKIHELIEFPKHIDHRGVLSIIEFEGLIPFVPKRLFYVQNPSGKRGEHAHKTTIEMIFMLSGEMTVMLENARGTTTTRLVNNNRCLLVPKLTWIEIFDFSANCMYAVLANEAYNDAGYVRERAHFEQIMK